MTDARVASLLSFYQSRSADDCEKQAGGKFADGNDCAKSSGGGEDQKKKPASSGGGTMPTGKVEDPSAGYSWLSPSGTFHPFPRSKPDKLRLKSPQGFTTHDEWAKLHGVENGEKELLSKGWARVLRAGSSLYASTADGTALTSGQRKSLKDHAIINGGYDEVLHDAASGGKIRRTLWAKDQRSYCPTGKGGGVDNSCGAGLSVSHSESKDAFGKETYQLGGETLKNHRYSIKDKSTGGTADLKVGAYTDYSEGNFDPQATAVTIVSWHATPMSEIAAHGLVASDKYKGKGFGRGVMKSALEIADRHNATVLSIFAPSDDSQAVMKHYSDTGLLEPIKSSKAVYGDFYTSFIINKAKAKQFLDGRPKKDSRSADCGRDNGGRFGPKNTCQEMGDEFEPMPHGDWKSLKPDPGYVYHATSQEAAGDITEGGLLTFGPSHGTDQDTWPDGSDKDRAYFATSPATAYGFAPESGKKVLLRVPRLDSMEDESGTGDVVSHSPVDASKLEALGSDGVWVPLRRTPSSPSFDKWFEDSQVVDGNGRPKVLFHGTDATFDEFDAGEFGFHFGDEQAASMQGGSSMPVVLSIKNPLRLKDLGVWNPDRVLKALRKEADIPKEAIAEAEAESDKLHDQLVDRLDDDNDLHDARKAHYEWSAPVRELLDRHGYYGIVYQNEAEGFGDSYIAFRPEQIKSAAENSGDYDPTKKSIKRSADDCGRDEGGRFGKGNTCQALLDQLSDALGDHEAEGGKLVGGLRNKYGEQTDVSRKLNQMGVKEEALADLIKQMGGQPAKTRSQIAKHVVHIAVVSHKGEDLYHIDLGYMEAKIYSTGKSDQDLEKIKDAAARTFPSTYFRKGTPFEVHVHDNDDDFKEGKFTDKSSRSLALRMESLKAFHESRNCGTGPGGFQPGNTCAHSKTADVASGAAKGAALGAGSAVVSLAPYPPYIAKGAAVGAVVGAANGLARNLTRSDRIKAKIAEIGSTEKKVASMVKKLGGTERTKADVKGDALHITVVNSKGQKSFNVDMTKSTITVYPRSQTGRLSDAEISRVKSIAKASVPKTTEIVVKSNSQAYVVKLIKSGFKVLATTAGALVAAYVVPTVVDVAAGDIAHAVRTRRGKR